MGEPRTFHGYHLKWLGAAVDNRGAREGPTRDTVSATLQIVEDATGAVIHTITTQNRGSHHLNTRSRAAMVDADSMIGEAETWILTNRPDARARREAERNAQYERNRQWRRDQLAAHGGDLVAYATATAPSLSTTEVGEVLGLGTARRLNPW